jgi:hypothetical protein
VAFIRDGRVLALDTPSGLQRTLNVQDMEGVFLELAK